MESTANPTLATHHELITEDALKQWVGLKQRQALKRWLQEKNIRFFQGKDRRICTTATKINAALEDKLDFEIDFIKNGTSS